MIATYGCSCSTCTTSQGTPAFVAASFATLRYFAVSVAARVLYSFGVSVTMLGSTAKVWNGADTVTAVTLAPRAFASPSPCPMAFADSSDPSVGIRMCLYTFTSQTCRQNQGSLSKSKFLYCDLVTGFDLGQM